MAWPTADEFSATANWAQAGANGLGWNVTIGDDVIAEHLPLDSWGWNARAASQWYLAVEFAQPSLADQISNAQVRVFAWWVRERALKRWPAMPLTFPTHAELEASGATGKKDGKTDVFPDGNALRARIMAAL